MTLLGIDAGTRRTGVAFADTKAGFVMALDTIKHKTPEELVVRITELAKAKNASEIIMGLPRLPQGEEGRQAGLVRELAAALEKALGIPVQLIDERYSSQGGAHGTDPDAKAACEMLSVVLDQRKKDY
ncbi:MAG: Holliday junction resolvase RuvX [Candidatus Peribacteraceae bacterium]|nr:Holliday junction resolvase RuvX [Candidatus Peribacteraceae bacterium]